MLAVYSKDLFAYYSTNLSEGSTPTY